MGRGLADRRSKMDNAKARALKIIKSRQFRGDTSAENPAAVGFTATTPHACSCWSCANERRSAKGHKRLTLQERREKLNDAQM